MLVGVEGFFVDVGARDAVPSSVAKPLATRLMSAAKSVPNGTIAPRIEIIASCLRERRCSISAICSCTMPTIRYAMLDGSESSTSRVSFVQFSLLRKGFPYELLREAERVASSRAEVEDELRAQEEAFNAFHADLCHTAGALADLGLEATESARAHGYDVSQ